MHGPLNVRFLHSVKSSNSTEHVSIVLSLNYSDF